MKRVLSILILSVIIPFVSFSQDLGLFIVGEKIYLPPLTLEEIVENVKDMNANKAPKNEIASWMAKVIDYRITNMNSAEYFFDRRTYSGEGPESFYDWSDRNIYDYKISAKWAWSNRMGNCEENSNIVYYILKQAGVPKDFRQLSTGKHQFTVWGIAPGADISNPDTWGPNAIVIDPWLGYTVDSDGVKYGKWYMNGDPTIKPADVTSVFDNDWKIILELEGCWNLRTDPYVSQINVYLDPKQGIYNAVLTVNNLENYKNGQLMFSVYRISENTFEGKEYTFNIDNNGRTIQKEIPVTIAIKSNGNELIWTSDERVEMQRCN